MENKEKNEVIEKLIEVRRVSKVVKGGRRFGYSALVVCGNANGKAGFGTSKALEVSEAVKRATERAKARMKSYSIINRSFPHEVFSKFGASKLVIKPAPEGSGIISCGPVRSVMECVGVHNINIKALGSRNANNLVRSTFKALEFIKPLSEVQKVRGIVSETPETDQNNETAETVKSE